MSVVSVRCYSNSTAMLKKTKERKKEGQPYPFNRLINCVHNEMPTSLKALNSPQVKQKDPPGTERQKDDMYIRPTVNRCPPPPFYNPLIFTYRLL